MKIVEQKYIKEFIQAGKAKIVSSEFGRLFNQYLCENHQFDVTGTRLDWSEKYINRINWLSASEDDVELFLNKSVLSNFENVCVIYGVTQPCLMVPFQNVVKDLDVLMCHGSGTRFLVGFNSEGCQLELAKEVFVEVDGERWLTVERGRLG